MFRKTDLLLDLDFLKAGCEFRDQTRIEAREFLQAHLLLVAIREMR